MLTIYLASLNNLLYENNPFRLLLLQSYRNIKSFWNLPKNRKRAEKRIYQLQNRLQAVEAYVDTYSKSSGTHRFDVTR
jgi:hypothetical protein